MRYAVAGSANSGGAFLAASPDAGASGLQFAQVVQLEAAQITGQPHVTWSVATGAFTFSWEYVDGSWFVKLKNFLPSGQSAGGDIDVVPTNDPTGAIYNSGYQQDEGAVGPSASTGLFGVAYISAISGWQRLTVLDTESNQVGDVADVDNISGQWVAVAGTPQGFVYAYDVGSGVDEKSLPVSADAGVAMTHVGPTSVIAHAYEAGDQININNVGGSFGLSIYSSVAQSTQVAASGCATQ